MYNNQKDLEKITKIAEDQKGDLKFDIKPADKENVFLGMLSTLIPILLLAFVFIFFLSQSQGGGGGGRVMNFGKSKAKLYDDKKKKYVSVMLLELMKRSKSLLKLSIS